MRNLKGYVKIIYQKKKILSKKIINYKSNNKPMTEEQQKKALAKFEKWKKKFL
jgi:hypothetical protein